VSGAEAGGHPIGVLAWVGLIARISIPFVHGAADSAARAAAASAAHAAEWTRFAESWHEFFLMAGTAAVTLAGLLFVALSLHVETLIHESREHLLSLARAILFSFVMVLTLSLMMLVPGYGMRVTAAELVVVGTALSVATLRQIRGRPGVEQAEFTHSLYRRRLVIPLIGYAWIALTGAGMLKFRDPELFYLVVGAVCMLLGNAAGTSWDLLVRTARIRRGSEGKRPTG
jgi:hypothetical protein